MRNVRVIGLCLATALACSPKDPGDTDPSTGGGASSSSGAPTTGTPTTGTADASSSGPDSATGDDSSGTATTVGTLGTTTTGETTTTGDPTTTGATTTTGETATGTSDGSDDTGSALACDGAGMSNLDGVCIVFPAQQTSFTLAEAKAGIEFAYAVVVTADVVGVTSEALVTCAQPGPGGLLVREKVANDLQSYCVCDSGLCPEPPLTPFTLEQGEYPAVFPWDGVNWNGPSDTNNPKGKPFPPGSYTVQVTAVGTHGGQDYEVVGELAITITQ